jgi:hypothetical protein
MVGLRVNVNLKQGRVIQRRAVLIRRPK